MSPVRFCGRELLGPILAEAGTFGTGREAERGGFLPATLGGVILPSISLNPAAARESIFEAAYRETPAGIFEDWRLLETEENLKSLVGEPPPRPVWLSVVDDGCPGTDAEAFAAIIHDTLAKLLARPEVAGLGNLLHGIELDLAATLEAGPETAKSLAGFMAAARHGAAGRPVMLKVSALARVAPRELAKLARDEGLAAVSISAGVPVYDAQRARRARLHNPSLLPLHLRWIEEFQTESSAENSMVELAAGGGVSTAPDAKFYLDAGCRVITVGVSTLVDPGWVDRVSGQL